MASRDADRNVVPLDESQLEGQCAYVPLSDLVIFGW